MDEKQANMVSTSTKRRQAQLNHNLWANIFIVLLTMIAKISSHILYEIYRIVSISTKTFVTARTVDEKAIEYRRPCGWTAWRTKI